MTSENSMDINGALQRALAAMNGDDKTARNDALVLLEMATVFRHGISIDFEGLAVAGTANRGDAVNNIASVFDINSHLRAVRLEADWQSITMIDSFIAERSLSRRESAQDSPIYELFKLINEGELDKADELHTRLANEGTAGTLSLDDARTAIDNRRWESGVGLR